MGKRIFLYWNKFVEDHKVLICCFLKFFSGGKLVKINYFLVRERLHLCCLVLSAVWIWCSSRKLKQKIIVERIYIYSHGPLKNNIHLMSAPRKKISFVFPRDTREKPRFEGKQNSLFPEGNLPKWFPQHFLLPAVYFFVSFRFCSL